MALISFTGVLHKALPVASGTSKSGNEWKKQTIVFKMDEAKEGFEYIALSAFGDKVDTIGKIKPGTRVNVKYSISAREYNGNWFNDLNIYNVESFGGESQKKEEETAKGDLPF